MKKLLFALFLLMPALAIGDSNKDKLDIKPISEGIEFIDKLKPVSYRLATDTTKLQYGFAVVDTTEQPFAPEDFLFPVVKAVQEVHEELHAALKLAEIQQAEIA